MLSSANEVEVHHEPALHKVKNKLWYPILKDYNLSVDKLLSLKKTNESSTDLAKLITDSTNVSDFLASYWRKVKKELHCFIVHKRCNREKSKHELCLANQERKVINAECPQHLHANYVKFSKGLTRRMRSTYELSPSQKNALWDKSEVDLTFKKKNSHNSWEPYSQ